jgi:hypothetical protein
MSVSEFFKYRNLAFVSTFDLFTVLLMLLWGPFMHSKSFSSSTIRFLVFEEMLR